MRAKVAYLGPILGKYVEQTSTLSGRLTSVYIKILLYMIQVTLASTINKIFTAFWMLPCVSIFIAQVFDCLIAYVIGLITARAGSTIIKGTITSTCLINSLCISKDNGKQEQSES